ncbi:MAG: GumC family protein [Myxococcaceae bacterium]
MTADQVLAALWRRKALVFAIALSVFAVGATVVMTMPSVYEATAVVRYDAQFPDGEMVRRTVGDQLEGRLLTVRQQLLGRPVLQRLIEEMNLYPELISKHGMDAAVEALRRDIDVKVEGEHAFELTVRATTAPLASKVANRLPEIFAEENVKVRKEQAERATSVFADEIDQLKKDNAAWEQKIAQFKVDHMGELPEQLESNMRGLERISGLINQKMDALRTAEIRRSDMVRAGWAHDSEAGRMEAAEQALVQQLAVAQQTYTADHPEVQRLMKEVSAMKSKRIDAEGRMTSEKRERIAAAQMVQDFQKDIKELQAQADVYQKRLDATPKWAHELGVMQRDYEIVRQKYQSLISRKVEAELAQDLEMRNATELYNVISPAVTPSAPARPDRMSGLMLAFLVALGLGVLTAVVVELRDDSIRDPATVKQSLPPMPVLAVIPQLSGKTEKRVLMPARNTNNNLNTTLN